jgi:hypothetical protein
VPGCTASPPSSSHPTTAFAPRFPPQRSPTSLTRGSIAFPVWFRAESPRRGTASPELHPCAIADSLVDTSAYVCLRVPAPRAPHTHACTSSSCSATSPGARPLHASPVCRSRLRKSNLRAPALALQRAACRPLPHTPPRRASTCIRCYSTPAEPLTRAPPTASPAPFAHHCSFRAACLHTVLASAALVRVPLCSITPRRHFSVARAVLH